MNAEFQKKFNEMAQRLGWTEEVKAEVSEFISEVSSEAYRDGSDTANYNAAINSQTDNW